MAESQNTQLVKDAYAAFKRGDIASILQMTDDNIEWHGVIGTEGVLPQAGLRHGRAGVAEFFQQVSDTTDFMAFEPAEFIAEGDKVAVVGSYKARVKPSGGMVSSPWVMIFTIRGGKFVRFREFTDSAQLVRAFTGTAMKV